MFLLHVLVGSGLGEGSVDCGVRAVLCQKINKKSPSAGQIDGIINTGDWKDD